MKAKKKIYHFILLGFSLLFFFFYFFLAKDRTIFLRDDYDVLRLLPKFNFKHIFQSHNEHFIPFLRLFYFLQYKLFGINFAGYLAVGIVIHLATGWVVFLLTKLLSKNYFLSFLAAVCFFSTAGASYKIFVLMISQIWLFECLFASLTLYFFLKYLINQRKSSLFFYFSLLSALLTLTVSVIGIGLLLAIGLSIVLVEKAEVKKIFLTFLLSLIALPFYLLNTFKSSFKAVNASLSFFYPILILRFIIMGTIWGSLLLLVFPWYNLFRPLPKLFWLKLAIGLVPVLLFLITAFFVFKFLNLIKKHKDILVVLSLFIMGHFSIIGLGRTANLGYALSPQYTYFPRLVLIILFFYLLSKIKIKPDRLKMLGFLTAGWLIINQTLYFNFQMIKWEKRYNYTQTFLKDLKYVLKTQPEVLNLFCPDSISPVTKYSDLAKIYYPGIKVKFVSQEKINLDDYLSKVKDEEKIYKFYLKAKQGFDIKHY
jgi:hypothetical protein